MVPAALGQWDHNITPGWLLALHQALNVGVIQWHFHNFWACLRMGHSPSFVGLAIGFIILAILVLVRHGAQLQPCFTPLGNEILEARMVGKGCVRFDLGPTEELVELVIGWPELQPLAAIMFHNQGRWDGNSFGTIAADGYPAFDFNLHGCQLEQYLLS